MSDTVKRRWFQFHLITWLVFHLCLAAVLFGNLAWYVVAEEEIVTPSDLSIKARLDRGETIYFTVQESRMGWPISFYWHKKFLENDGVQWRPAERYQYPIYWWLALAFDVWLCFVLLVLIVFLMEVLSRRVFYKRQSPS